MSEWQSIETAPRDGTKILVAFNSLSGGKSVATARCIDGLWIGGLAVDKTTGDLEIIRMESRPPTHWMPAPEPPK